MATAVLATIGIVGFTAGLAKLNALGERIIPINLAVIGGFLFGLLAFNIGERLKGCVSYQFIVVPAIGLTWLTNINEVIGLASRAFAAYYAIECVIAIRISLGRPTGRVRTFSVIGMGAMTVFMTGIAVFSIPT